MIQSIVPHKSNALVFLWPCFALTAVQKQPNLTFQTNFVHAVNHWVVLPKNGSELHYLYGYLYFDPAKGIVFYLENTIAFDGTWKLNREPKSYVLQKTMRDPEMNVALLPKSIQQLWNLPEGGVPYDESIVLDDFKDGAFRLAIEHNLPIVPLTFPDNKKRFSYTFFSGSPGIMRAHVHHFVSTSGKSIESKAEIKALNEEVRTVILDKLRNY